MDELYQAIEEKIKAAGYPREYPDRLFTKISVTRLKEKKMAVMYYCPEFEDDVIFEYHITIMDHEFNLGILTMRLPEGVYAANFDED